MKWSMFLGYAESSDRTVNPIQKLEREAGELKIIAVSIRDR